LRFLPYVQSAASDNGWTERVLPKEGMSIAFTQATFEARDT
jgi:hypothetical protein